MDLIDETHTHSMTLDLEYQTKLKYKVQRKRLYLARVSGLVGKNEKDLSGP